MTDPAVTYTFTAGSALGLFVGLSLLGWIAALFGAFVQRRLGSRWLWLAASLAFLVWPIAFWPDLSAEWRTNHTFFVTISTVTAGLGFSIAPALGVWRVRGRQSDLEWWRHAGFGLAAVYVFFGGLVLLALTAVGAAKLYRAL
jgi:hypothetical protein